jgi:hypothetical protein
MKNRKAGFWQALEAVPGLAAVDAEWKVRFGSDYGTARDFLRPNGRWRLHIPVWFNTAAAVNTKWSCTIRRTRRVCRCDRGCETLPCTDPTSWSMSWTAAYLTRRSPRSSVCSRRQTRRPTFLERRASAFTLRMPDIAFGLPDNSDRARRFQQDP